MARAAAPLLASLVDDGRTLPTGLRPGKALLRVRVGEEGRYSATALQSVEMVKAADEWHIVFPIGSDKYVVDGAPGLHFFDSLVFSHAQIVTAYRQRGELEGGCTYVQLPDDCPPLIEDTDFDQVVLDHPVAKKLKAEGSGGLPATSAAPQGLLAPGASAASAAVTGDPVLYAHALVKDYKRKLEQRLQLAASQAVAAGKKSFVAEGEPVVREAYREVAHEIDEGTLQGPAAVTVSKMLPPLFTKVAEHLFGMKNSSATLAARFELADELAETGANLAIRIRLLLARFGPFLRELRKEVDRVADEERQAALIEGLKKSQAQAPRRADKNPGTKPARNQWQSGGCASWDGARCERMARDGKCDWAACHIQGTVGSMFARRNPGRATGLRVRLE